MIIVNGRVYSLQENWQLHARDWEGFYIEEKYLFPYVVEIKNHVEVEPEPSIFDIFGMMGQE